MDELKIKPFRALEYIKTDEDLREYVLEIGRLTRSDVLEEAAKACDHKKQWSEYYAGAEECAAAIRALKGEK